MGEVIWLVSQGEYDDYHPIAACRTEADADTLAKRIGPDADAFTEPLPIVSADVEPVPVLHLETTITDSGIIRLDTDEHDYREWVDVVWPWNAGEACYWHWSGLTVRHQGMLTAYGHDHEQVRKVFSDQRAMLLADGADRLSRRGTQ